MKLLETLISKFFIKVQKTFSFVEEEMGELTERHRKFIFLLEMIPLEGLVKCKYFRDEGRPEISRIAIARSFIAKTFYNLSTNTMLIDRLHCDHTLRRLCGFERKSDIPSESTYSRVFHAFAEYRLPEKIHEAMVKEAFEERMVGHISRDSTAIKAREVPKRKEKKEKVSKKRGRPRQGEPIEPKESTRLEQQLHMNLTEMIQDLPKDCDVGTKKNSQGYRSTWTGYKLHIDTTDGDIPISAVLTSASVHDSQVSIPLSFMTADRCTSLYDLMDSAYDAPEIKIVSRQLGHVPIIDTNPRRNKELSNEISNEARRKKILHFKMAEDIRYNQRSASERVNARFKDEFGGNTIRVRGHAKVFCHVMFGVLVLTADQLLRLFGL